MIRKFISVIIMAALCLGVINVCSAPAAMPVNMTFSESVFTLGSSVNNVGGWSQSYRNTSTTANGSNVVVAADPDDSNNRVLKMTTTTKGTSGNASLEYSLDVGDAPDDKILKVSYKVKLDGTSVRPAQWTSNLGTLTVGPGTPDGYARFAKWSFYNTRDEFDLESYAAKDDTWGANQLHDSTFDPLGKWILIEEQIDFSDCSIKAKATDLSSGAVKEIGYTDKRYATEKSDAFDRAVSLKFSTDIPCPSTGTATCILYVDDIIVERLGANPPLTATVSNVSLGAISVFNLTASNGILPLGLDGKISVTKSGAEVTSANITLEAVSNNSVNIIIGGLALQTDYNLIVKKGITDEFGQNMADNLNHPFNTGNGAPPSATEAIATFSEPGYIKDKPVNGVNGWSVIGAERTGESAVVAEDPDDPNNMVLKITTLRNPSAPAYKFAFNDSSGNRVYKISYKVKFDDVNSSKVFGWGGHMGTSHVVGHGDPAEYGDFAKWYFENGTKITNVAFKEMGNWDSKVELQTFDAFTGRWVQIDEILDLYAGTIAATITDVNKTANPPQMKIGYSETLYAYDKGALFDKVDYIHFSAAPDKAATGAGIMYVDDIMITTMPPLLAQEQFASTDVSPQNPLVVNFNGEVEAADVKNALTISEGGKRIPNNITVSMSADKKTATITIANGLKYNTAYVFELKNTFSDNTGAKMAADIKKTFITLFSDNAHVNSFKSVTFSNAGGACQPEAATKVTVTLEVKNPTLQVQSPFVIVAAYTNKNRMLGYTAMNALNIPAGQKSADMVFEIDNLPPGTFAVKAFVWSSQGQLKLNSMPFVYTSPQN